MTLKRIWSPLGVYVGLAVFSLAGSALCRSTGMDPTPVARPVAVLTLASGCFAAFEGIFRMDRRGALLAVGSVFALGLVSELVGLATGFPFGRYGYTSRWWPVIDLPGIGNFPLQLPFAWMLVAGCAYLAAAGGWWSAPVAALIAVGVDQAMEPAMTGSLRYWVWLDRGPFAGSSPLENAVGWFGVSLLAAAAMQKVLGNRAVSKTTPTAVLAIYVALIAGIGGLASAPR